MCVEGEAAFNSRFTEWPFSVKQKWRHGYKTAWSMLGDWFGSLVGHVCTEESWACNSVGKVLCTMHKALGLMPSSIESLNVVAHLNPNTERLEQEVQGHSQLLQWLWDQLKLHEWDFIFKKNCRKARTEHLNYWWGELQMSDSCAVECLLAADTGEHLMLLKTGKDKVNMREVTKRRCTYVNLQGLEMNQICWTWVDDGGIS